MHIVDFSTRAADVTERHRQWVAVTGLGRTQLRDDGIEASIRGGDVGGARICSVAIGGHRIVSDEHGATGGAIKFVFQEEGSCLIEQACRSIPLLAGQWCAYDKSQPFRITADSFSRQTALILPLAATRGTHRWAPHMMNGHGALAGADKILHGSLIAAIDQIGSLTECGAQMLGQALVNLAEMTMLSDVGAGGNPLRDARRARVIAYVDRNLEDPDLGIDRIAASLACSKRYLHKLFLDQDTTLARLIWNRRLDRCRQDLGDPGSAGRTITDIAFAWGFNDSHHFSRLFKERFGTTPRTYRKEGAAH